MFVLWRDQEDDAGCVAYWADDHLKLLEIHNPDFWRRHDLQQPRREDGAGVSSRNEADFFDFIADLPEFAEAARESIQRISAAYFSAFAIAAAFSSSILLADRTKAVP